MRSRHDSPLFDRGLYLILTEPRDGYATLTRMAVKARLPVIQLRYKGADDNILLSLAETMRGLTAGSKTLFIVNDRPDVALAVNADGVHVGQEDLAPSEVRRMVGENMVIGLSTHNLDQVEKANQEPVDYIGFGPLFATTSKAKPDPVIGPEKLALAARISRHPITAIGGITLERLRLPAFSACRNIAVISAVSLAQDPFQAMQTFNEFIREEKKICNLK